MQGNHDAKALHFQAIKQQLLKAQDGERKLAEQLRTAKKREDQHAKKIAKFLGVEETQIEVLVNRLAGGGGGEG